MTKDELTAAAAACAETSDADAERVVTGVIDAITEALGNGDVVELGDLGRFVTRAEGAHETHVPGQEAPVQVPAHTRVLFHPAKALREALPTPAAA